MVLGAPAHQGTPGGGWGRQWGRGYVQGLVVAAGNNGQEEVEVGGRRTHPHAEERMGAGRLVAREEGAGLQRRGRVAVTRGSRGEAGPRSGGPEAWLPPGPRWGAARGGGGRGRCRAAQV